MNRRECCENVGDVGYCESYLGVKYPSVRPLSSINVMEQMESWYLQRSRHQKEKTEQTAGNSIICITGECMATGTNPARYVAQEGV